MQSQPPAKDSFFSWQSGLLAVILAAAACLRGYDLGRTSLWYDEAVSWSQSTGSLAQLLTSVAGDNYPPLHNLVLWITIPIIGDSETALRLPSVFFGVFAVWLLYLLGKAIGSKTTGLLAAALLAASPFHIWYSTEARMYALMATCGLWFLLCVLRTAKTGSLTWAAALAISSALFLYTHIFAAFGFATVGLVCFILAIRDWRQATVFWKGRFTVVCIGMAAGGIAFLPWLIILAGRASDVAEKGFWIAYPDAGFLKHMLSEIAGSWDLFLVLAVLSLFAGTLLCIPRIRKSLLPSASAETVLICLGYTIGPIAFGYLASITIQPILFDRYLIATFPGLILLAALAATSVAGTAGGIILFFLSLTLTWNTLDWTLHHKLRPEWRDAVQAYEQNSQEGDTLVLFKGFAAPALDYYLRDTDIKYQPAETFADIEASDGAKLSTSRWLLLVHSNEEETERALKAFDPELPQPTVKVFGWGASGITLVRAGN